MHTSTTDFTLRGGDAAFANRQKRLFDQLSIAESQCNKPERLKNDFTAMCADNASQGSSTIDIEPRRLTKRFRGRQSMFKRPEGVAPRAVPKNIPDYHRRPHKWIKYTLDDVSSEDMTEHSNTQAAMSFLKELKARRKKEEVDKSEEDMDVDSYESDLQSCTKTTCKSNKRTAASQIVFKKPEIKEAKTSEAVVIETNEKPIFRSSKIILPEYVIGQAPKKSPKQNRPAVKVDRSKELRLDHLQEPDEEEDN